MRYSDEIVEEVREKNDIVEVIAQYVKLTRHGANYTGLCPFHNEKTPSFSVSASRQLYYCFGCGAGGNVFNFIMQYENASFSEALSMLADRAGVTLPKIEYSPQAKEKADKRNALLEINKAAAAYYYYLLHSRAGSDAYGYLTGRGLSENTISRFGLGYAPAQGTALYRYLKSKGYGDELLSQSGLFITDSPRGAYDKFRDRVMYPIMDASSRVIGFGGRVMGDGKPKYLNSPETMIFDKGRTLYALHAARSSREKQMILCEGYMDVISMHQAGFTNAVATLGTAMTSAHASLIRRYTEEVLLLYDSDEAGLKAAARAVPILTQAGVKSRVVSLLPAKDPDEFIKRFGGDKFRERLSGARDSFLFLIDREAAGCEMDTPQGRNRFYEKCAERLLELEDELERNLYTEAILKEYPSEGVTAQDLHKRVKGLALKGRGRQTVPEPVRPASGGRREPEKPKDRAGTEAQKLVLTWLVTWPETGPLLFGYLEPSDFTKPLYREAAEMLLEQYGQGEICPARLLNAFPDSVEQSEVAALFNASIHLDKEAEIGQAFADAVIRIREDSLALQKSRGDPADMNEIMRFLEKSRQLHSLKAARMDIARKCNEIIARSSAGTGLHSAEKDGLTDMEDY